MIKVIQTAKDEGIPWCEKEQLKFEEIYNFRVDTVNVNSSKTFQTHMGFGGAFTEASAYTVANTNEKNRKEIVKAYFNKDEGLAYNLGRTTIGGCDFALEPYMYVKEGDDSLQTFRIERDDKWVVPFIKEAEKEYGGHLSLLCSPWSPPAFMKNNNDVNHGGKLLKKYYRTWAKYMTKYILEMKKRGIVFSMVSIQNEPEATQEWASCRYDAAQEAEFAVDYLYDELQEAGLAEDVKIVIWDHNKDRIYRRVKEVLSYKNAKDVVWGIAYHWYVTDKSENLSMVHNAFPNKHLLFTEGCVELINISGGTSSKAGMGAWKHGETYGRNIINDFNHFNEAWIDWNLVLNEEGGPNYVGNYCEAPILIDRNTETIVYNWSYYYIGHFSRYIKPGAKRLLCETDSLKGIYAVAYKNPEGEIVVVSQNETGKKKRIALVVDGRGVNTELPAHSITTFIISSLKG
ncbi:glycoside hydrolase family 30 protein [uncultured Eubacterium sp.]|uniref:glycoside hydrolase family 30 protein n=1 Tax=uncultured Eubacterium sp. TaxID=165185 RepID=UPI0026735B29|nr:glycoside hydrolase family 30 protein [uncultured Eubacterium sp.]